MPDGLYIEVRLLAKYKRGARLRAGGGLTIPVDCDLIDKDGKTYKIGVFRYGPVMTPTEVFLPPLEEGQKYRLIGTFEGKLYPKELTPDSMKPGAGPRRIVFEVEAPAVAARAPRGPTAPPPPPRPGPAPGPAAGEGAVEGYVTDAVTEKPIENCIIYLAEIITVPEDELEARVDEEPYAIKTDDKGYYTIPDLPLRPYTIKVKHPEYFPPKPDIKIQLTRTRRIRSQDITLVSKYPNFERSLSDKHGLTPDFIRDLLFKGWGEVEKKLREADTEEDIIEDMRKKRPKIHKDWDKYGEKLKEIDKHLPKIRFPEIVKKPVIETGRILGGLSTAIGGIMLVSILRIESTYFYLGFLFLALYVVLPGGPDVFFRAVKEMEKIRSDYETQITNALNADPPRFEEAADLAKIMEARINAAKSLGEYEKWTQVLKPGSVTFGLKQLAKIVGLGLLLLGIGGSGLPMAAIIALIGGFIAYFSFTVARSIPEEKKEE